MSRVAVRLDIKGRVQGVGYRQWLEGEARRRGVTGTVRNRRDGSVEAICALSEDALAPLLAACRRGPPGARIDAIEVHPLDGPDATAALASTGFIRLPTR